MPNYRRRFLPGGTYFFTLVTEHRSQFLCQPNARRLLRQAFRKCRQLRPFCIEAIVLLPDHLHTIWTLPHGDDDFATRWSHIKGSFTHAWLKHGGREESVNASRTHHRRRGVWQRRYWEHALRDEADYERHVEYIHYNPVKHGLVKCPSDWPYSSFHRYVSLGQYTMDWCCPKKNPPTVPPNFDDISSTVGE